MNVTMLILLMIVMTMRIVPTRRDLICVLVIKALRGMELIVKVRFANYIYS